MNYAIISEPKYKNMVVVILEGTTVDDEYETLEQLFSKEDFDNKGATELTRILSLCYNEEVAPSEIESDIYNIQYCNLNECRELNAHEVMYYDENGTCYDIVMDWYFQ